MLKDRVKQKAKTKAKQKVRTEAKSKIQEAGRKEDAPRVLKAATAGGTAYQGGKNIDGDSDSGKAAAGTDTVAKLQQLADMHESGVLTDEEFSNAKQNLLAGR